MLMVITKQETAITTTATITIIRTTAVTMTVTTITKTVITTNTNTGDDTYELEAKTSEYAKDWVQHIETAIVLLRQTPLFIYNNVCHYLTLT